MSLNLELSPALEARLAEGATQRGVSPAEYARTLIEAALGRAPSSPGSSRPFYETATREEWLQEFHKLIEEMALLDVPDLPDEAFRRENIYEDRW